MLESATPITEAGTPPSAARVTQTSPSSTGRTAAARPRRRFATQSARWAACLARDRSADGHFVFGVHTTGIFCRPSCAARRPLRANVCFYDDAAAARHAGLRPCRRCDPEGRGPEARDVARIARICRLLEHSAARLPLATLARRAALSPFHFHRLFKRLTGLTPAGYQRAQRSERLRARLHAGERVTDAVYAAGFGSSARFYAESDATLGMSPRSYRRGGEGSLIRFAVTRCWLGTLLVAATRRGVCAILPGEDAADLQNDLRRRFPRARLQPADRGFARLLSRVIRAVERPALAARLPLDLQGTVFQRRVWQALRAVPAGTTASYAEIARRIGHPRSVRAVGQAVGANPIAVAVPCHRIIRSDGSLCGYHWGSERKRALLTREAAGTGAAQTR
jgi:AraC family transcriptional regulator, regulatory protein of adaptative response / methylated-DNA-[protein]-cysteine methyltransferase